MASRTAALRPKRKTASRTPASPGAAADLVAGDLSGAFGLSGVGADPIAAQIASLEPFTSNNPLGVVVLDENQRVRMCNPAFEALFGYAQSDLLGSELDALLAPETLLSEAADISRRASAGEAVRARSKRRRSDGTLIDVQIIAVPLAVDG
ncbi:MAG: PAS domain S-box protein, partial [Candidatus Acidiferrales bacterium]